MLPKPSDCIGCTWYGDGQGFVPDRIPEGVKVLFLEQNPGKNEEEGRRVIGYEGARHEVTEPCPPQPLIGQTGYSFYKTFLPLAGLDPAEVGVANVLRCRKQLGRWAEVNVAGLDAEGNPLPPVYERQFIGEIDPTTGMAKRTNDMPTKDERVAIEHCTRAYLRVPDSVRLMVAQGAHAWRLMGGPQPLDDWRGYLTPEAVQVRKDGTLLSLNPVTEPEIVSNIPVLATLHIADLNHRPKMDLPTRKDFLKVGRILEGTWPWEWPRIHNANEISDETLWQWFLQAREAEFIVIDTEYDEDTKALSLLGVAVPEENQPVPVMQMHWFRPFISLGRRSYFLDLLTDLIGTVPTVFQNVLADMPVLRKVSGITWESFKRIEDTMQAHAVLWCELPHTLEFQASMDSRYNKTKHLYGIDVERYNAGDLMDTICAWQARLDDFSRDPQSRAVYDTQMLLLPYLDRSMGVGIAVDQEKVLPAIARYQERVVEGECMAQAYCGWPINLRSDDQLKVVLYAQEGMPVQKHSESRQPTTNADAIAVLRQRYSVEPEDDNNITSAIVQARIEQGAHPLLEAYVLHAHADHVLTQYLLPLVKA